MRVQHDGAAAVERQNSGYQFGIGADHMRSMGGNAESVQSQCDQKDIDSDHIHQDQLVNFYGADCHEDSENGVTEKSKADLRTVGC